MWIFLFLEVVAKLKRSGKSMILAASLVFQIVKGECMELTSSSFKQANPIPSLYTCEGKNISPPLAWKGAPDGTKSFVIIVDDPDAPSKTWVHWVLYNIPESVHEATEGNPPEKGFQGTNDFGKTGYGGPCPPSGVHRYFFKLYALDQVLNIPHGGSKEQVEKAMEGHILDQTELVGTYAKHR